METTICFLGAASNNERCYRVVQTLCHHFRDHYMHLYEPLSRFNFYSFIRGVPRQCKLTAQLRLYEHLCGSMYVVF